MYPEDHKPVTTNAEQMFISCWKEMNSSRVVAGFTGALAALTALQFIRLLPYKITQ